MGEYYFHLDQLTVGYNGKPLIDQIQVGIHKGEIVTLIGTERIRKINNFKEYHQTAEDTWW